MSIARAACQVLKVRRTLMFSAAMCALQIKDLKDLRALLCRRDTIDMQDLKALKRCFRAGARGGNPLACACGIRGPPRYGHIETRRSLLRGRHRNMKHPQSYLWFLQVGGTSLSRYVAHRDREVSPTGMHRDREGSPTSTFQRDSLRVPTIDVSAGPRRHTHPMCRRCG